MLRERPELPRALLWYYQRFFEVDRDGMSGRPLFRGMCDVLDEYGVRAPAEREAVREIWWAMAAVEGEVRQERAEREESRRDKDGRDSGGGRAVGHGASRRRA